MDDDPFDELVLDEDFIRGGRYEAPARTREALARHPSAPDPWRAPEPPPPRQPRRRARRAVTLGLLLALLVGGGLVVATRHHPSATKATAPKPGRSPTPSPSSSEQELLDASLSRGECATWDERVAQPRVAPVLCAASHLFQAVSAGSVTGAVARGAYPSEATWGRLTQQLCGQSVAGFLGYTPTPLSTVAVGILRPTQHGWARGDRRVHCGVQDGRLDGPGSDTGPYAPVLTAFAGDARHLPRWWTPRVGTCTAPVADHVQGGTRDETVPCSARHDTEYVGSVVVSARTYPSGDAQSELVGPSCGRVADAYAGRTLPKYGRSYVVGWVVDRASWAAGDRLFACEVSSYGYGTSIGSVRGSGLSA